MSLCWLENSRTLNNWVIERRILGKGYSMQRCVFCIWFKGTWKTECIWDVEGNSWSTRWLHLCFPVLWMVKNIVCSIGDLIVKFVNMNVVWVVTREVMSNDMSWGYLSAGDYTHCCAWRRLYWAIWSILSHCKNKLSTTWTLDEWLTYGICRVVCIHIEFEMGLGEWNKVLQKYLTQWRH